jgi:hypothetical protein
MMWAIKRSFLFSVYLNKVLISQLGLGTHYRCNVPIQIWLFKSGRFPPFLKGGSGGIWTVPLSNPPKSPFEKKGL